MANRSLGTLTLNMVLNTGSFVEGQSRAERSMDRTAKAAQRQVTDLAKLVGQIDPLTTKMAQLEAQQQKLADFNERGVFSGREFEVLSGQLDKVKNEAYAANSAFAEQYQQINRVVNQLDPAIAKYAELDNMQARLAEGVTIGVIGGEDYTRYTQQLTELRAEYDRVYTAAGKLSEEQKKQQTELQSLLRQLDPVTAKLADLEAQQQKLASAFSAGDIDKGQYDKAIVKLNQMRASLDGTTDAQNKADAANKQQQAELQKLAQRFDPVTFEIKELDKAQEMLRAGLSKGLINPAEYEKLSTSIGNTRTQLTTLASDTKAAELSQKQLAFALRGVPAQFTDIAVSLQGGQNPLTVFLQQGGQLKDMFGGVGPAARAMGGYILGLVNPATLAAAAVGVLTLAYYQGSAELDAYRNALILTGNASGTTSDQLTEMAKRMDGAITTQRNAAKVLAEVAGAAKFTSDQIELVGTAAVQMEKATGKAVSDTIAEFVKLAEDPSKAIVELNKNQNFLTAAIYEQIAALQEQGDTQAAATLATTVYADTINARTGEITANLGYIEGSWKAIKSAATQAWDSILDVGRQNDPLKDMLDQSEQRIAQLRERVGRSFQIPAVRRINESNLAEEEQNNQWIRDQIAAQERLQKGWAEAEAEYNKTQQAAISAFAEVNKLSKETLTNDEKRAEAVKEYQANLDKIRKANPSSELLDEELVTKTLANIEAKFKNTTKKMQDDAGTQYLLRLREQEAAINEQLSSNIKLSQSQKELAKFEQKIADIKNKETLTAQQKSLLADEAAIRAQLQKNAAAEDELRLRTESARLQNYQNSLIATLQSEQQQNADKLAAFGMGDEALTRLREEEKIRRDINKQIERVTADNIAGKTTEQEYKSQIDMLKDSLSQRLDEQKKYYSELDRLEGDWANGARRAFANYQDEARNAAKISEGFFTSMFSSMENSVTQFALTGKFSFSDFTKSILSDMARIATQQAASQLLGMLVSWGVSAWGASAASPNASLPAGSGGTGMYSDGGYTGPGAKYQPAGVVHKGEVVWSQQDIARAGGVGVVEAMRKGYAGYANGGAVGADFTRMPAGAIGTANNFNFDMPITIEQGAGQQSGSVDAAAFSRGIQQQLKRVVQEEMQKAWRPGGINYKAARGIG